MMYRILNSALLTAVVALLSEIKTLIRLNLKLNAKMAARHARMTMTDEQVIEFVSKLYSEDDF